MVNAAGNRMDPWRWCVASCSLGVWLLVPAAFGEESLGIEPFHFSVTGQAPRFFELPEPPPPRAPTPNYCASADELAESLKPIGSISLAIRPPGDQIPRNCYDDYVSNTNQRPYPVHGPISQFRYHFFWQASGLVHGPLYFEDVPLERYGQGYSPVVQPVVSGWRFFTSAAFLPYRMGLDPPHRRIHSLGYHRPGSCAPAVRENLPWSWRGALAQMAVVVGGVLLFP